MFPGYVFVCIISQWDAARWVPGVIGFVMGGERPARVPEIGELKGRERNGAIALPGGATAGAVRTNGTACRFELDRSAVASGFTWSSAA